MISVSLDTLINIFLKNQSFDSTCCSCCHLFLVPFYRKKCLYCLLIQSPILCSSPSSQALPSPLCWPKVTIISKLQNPIITFCCTLLGLSAFFNRTDFPSLLKHFLLWLPEFSLSLTGHFSILFAYFSFSPLSWDV